MNLFKQKFVRVPHLSAVDSLRETSRNPFVDWILILILSLLIVITLVINGVVLYDRVISGDIQGKEVFNDNTIKTFDKNDLKLIINKVNNREELLMQAKRGYTDSINPAI